MRKIQVIVTAALCLLILPSVAFAQREHIFQIRARGIGGTSKARVLTGFRLRNVKGLITALHGVADARALSAANSAGTVFNDLRIVNVDIERDLAVLSNSDLNAMPSAGFDVTGIPSSGTKVTITGYPYGIEITETIFTLRNPNLRALETRIPPGAALTAFRQRNSPNPTIQIVDLQGPLVPGLSGAPVFDANGKVFAVGNGGLKEGDNDLVWAIPMQSATWNMAETIPERLKQTPLDALFLTQKDLPPVFPIKDEREDRGGVVGDKHIASSVLTITADGKATLKTKMENVDQTDGFCLRPLVVFYDDEKKVIHTFGEGHQWCACSGFEHRVKKLAGIDCPIIRSDMLSNDIAKKVLASTYSISIVHAQGSKDPFELLQDSNALKQVIRIIDR